MGPLRALFFLGGIAASVGFAAGCDGDIGDSQEGGESAAGGSGAGNSVGGGPPVTGPVTIDCTHKGSGTDYAVGPGQAYASLGEVPTELLTGGDTIRLFYRPEPYREKIMIGGKGTPDQPIRMCGVAGPNGELPIVDGSGATTRPESDFPFEGHQERGVIVLGHRHEDVYDEEPGPFVLEGVAVTGGTPLNEFTDIVGTVQPYSTAAAGIFVQRGRGITIRGCEVFGNGNGLFIGTSAESDATYDVLLESNYVHDNGVPGSDKQHNLYNEAIGVVHQFNHYGAPRADSYAGNVKERSAGVVIRYNHIEGGTHVLDIVDAQEAKITTVPLDSFHETFVYGNIIQLKTLSGSMVHYGGDSGVFEDYRKGTLYFFHNTMVVDTSAQTDFQTQPLLELSTNEETLWSRNNVYYATVEPTDLRPLCVLGPRDTITSGIADMAGDWASAGVTPYKMIPGDPINFQGQIDGLAPQAAGSLPGFVDMPGDDFRPGSGSPLIGAGIPLMNDLPASYLPSFSFTVGDPAAPRDDSTAPTLGALVP
jgi:hypothetical protein